MTVAELIEALREFPPEAEVFVLGGYDCDVPCEPNPEKVDDGVYPGVYL